MAAAVTRKIEELVVPLAHPQVAVVRVVAEEAHGGERAVGHLRVGLGVVVPAVHPGQPKVRVEVARVREPSVGEAALELAVGQRAEVFERDRAHVLLQRLGLEGRLEGVRDLVEPQVARRKGRRAGVEVLELGVVWQPHGQHQRPIQRVRLRESAPRRAA